MRWSVWEDGVGRKVRAMTVRLDGEEQRCVVAFDSEEGWVRRHCHGEKGEGHSFSQHQDPEDTERVCTVRVEGEVEVEDPLGFFGGQE